MLLTPIHPPWVDWQMEPPTEPHPNPWLPAPFKRPLRAWLANRLRVS